MIAQSVEHAAVNRGVVGSSPTQGVKALNEVFSSLVRSRTGLGKVFKNLIRGCVMAEKKLKGPMVKRLRHRPFTAVTGVQIPLGSLCSPSECEGDLALCSPDEVKGK